MDFGYTSNELLKARLDRLPESERKELLSVIEIGIAPLSTNDLVVSLSKFCANSIVSGVLDSTEPSSYLATLKTVANLLAPLNSDVLDKLISLDDCPDCSRTLIPHMGVACSHLENKILKLLFVEIYDSMSVDKRERFISDLTEMYPETERSIGGLATATGALLLANLGGFSTYVAMSSMLSAVSFGILGFGAYTTASSLLSIVLGPVGWVALGASAIHHFGKPDQQMMLRAIAVVATAAQLVKPNDTDASLVLDRSINATKVRDQVLPGENHHWSVFKRARNARKQELRAPSANALKKMIEENPDWVVAL